MTSPVVTHCLAFLTPFLLTHCNLPDPSFLQQASGRWGGRGEGACSTGGSIEILGSVRRERNLPVFCYFAGVIRKWTFWRSE